jgi:hypothetical protein
MKKAKRLLKLREALAAACCPACGQPYRKADQLPPIERKPEQDAIVLPIVIELVRRAPRLDLICRRCFRETELYDWHWLLRHATNQELAALERALQM